MAQKDIQDIAKYMQQLNESKDAEDKAYESACEEAEAFEAADFEQIEDEVIDPASVGFIDDSDIEQNEADEFYSEDEVDTFEEDVSDCQEQEVQEAEAQGSIEVAVYNEDGFGRYFCQDVMKNVPGVEAVEKKPAPNGDLIVKISGSQPDLQKAFAFYIGQPSYDALSRDDKEEFESLLVFDDGDTLAEADYREAVAHCLDPVGVKASTANLADQDACSISLIKEEKIKRQAKRIAKALQEDAIDALSDDDLEMLDDVKDAVDNDEEMDARHAKLWTQILAQMGYTPEEWDKMTPEQKDKIWKASEETPVTKTGFAKWQVGVDPKTGKKFRYQNQYKVYDPKTGEAGVTAFNPEYTSDVSTYQHPSAVRRQNKKDLATVDQKNKEQAARDAMAAARGKDTWSKEDFAKMIVALDDKQRKELMKELIADVEADNKDDPAAVGRETMFIKSLFGKKLTLRDIAKAWNKSAPGVMKFADETIAIWQKTLRDCGIKSIGQFANLPRGQFNMFLQKLKDNMGARRKGSIVAGR